MQSRLVAVSNDGQAIKFGVTHIGTARSSTIRVRPELSVVDNHQTAAQVDDRDPAMLHTQDADAGQSLAETQMGRVLDVVISLLALIVLLPVLALIALLVWAQDGGSPVFAHRRIGRYGVPFPCLKFRSMTVDAEERLEALLATDEEAAGDWARDQKLQDDPRITALGAILRKTSLDELPQLLNVLVGQMSLVGPRPIVESEIVRYGRYYQHYCSVRPGITGLWQVSGRNDVSYRRRVVLDTVYSRRKSLAGDLAILGRTVPAVVSGRGSS